MFSSPCLFWNRLLFYTQSLFAFRQYSSSMGKALLFGSLLAALIALFPWILEFSCRKSFPTNRKHVVLITGTSIGIGYDATFGLLEDGYIVFAGVRKEEDAERLMRDVKEFKSYGKNLDKRLHPIILDVTDKSTIDSAFKIVSDFLEENNLVLAGLVNNAGVGGASPCEFHPIKDIERIFRVNVFGPVGLTQKFLPLLRSSQGRLIFISSILGKFGIPLLGAYSASKHALEGFADSLRNELGPLGVSVSLVEPGLVKTAFHSSSDKLSSDLFNPEAAIIYAHWYTQEKAEKFKVIKEKGSASSVVTAAILHAMDSHQPKARYQVANYDGIPASIIDLLRRLLPERLLDKLLE